jgi:hypothetical protein
VRRPPIPISGTDQRSALPWQPHQVSEGKPTCQRGSWEVAATAACDPNVWTGGALQEKIGEDGVVLVLRQCIRPLGGAQVAPGHHGGKRACDLISG